MQRILSYSLSLIAIYGLYFLFAFFTVHEPLKIHECDFKVLFEKTEKMIVEGIIQ